MGRLATLSEDGSIHLVPICYAFDGESIYIGTEGSSKKVRSLGRDPRATLLIDMYYEDWSRLKSLMIQGEAEVHEGGEVFRQGRRLLYRKYRQYPREAPLEEGKSVVIRLRPRRVVSSNV